MVDDVRTVPRYRHNSDKVDERFAIPSIIDKRGLTFLSSLERSFEEIDSLIIRIFTFGAFGHFSIGTLEESAVTAEKLGKLVTSQPGEIRTSVDNGRVISPYILETTSASSNYQMTQISHHHYETTTQVDRSNHHAGILSGCYSSQYTKHIKAGSGIQTWAIL